MKSRAVSMALLATTVACLLTAPYSSAQEPGSPERAVNTEGGVGYIGGVDSASGFALRIAVSLLSNRGGSLGPRGEYDPHGTPPAVNAVLIVSVDENGFPHLPYFDVSIDLMRERLDTEPTTPRTGSSRTYFGVHMLGAGAHADASINNQWNMTFTLLGGWVDSRIVINDSVRLKLQGVLNALAAGFAQRLSGSSVFQVGGYTPELRAALTAEIGRYVRVTVGQEFLAFLGSCSNSGSDSSSGTICGADDSGATAATLLSRTRLRAEIGPESVHFYSEGAYSLQHTAVFGPASAAWDDDAFQVTAGLGGTF